MKGCRLILDLRNYEAVWLNPRYNLSNLYIMQMLRRVNIFTDLVKKKRLIAFNKYWTDSKLYPFNSDHFPKQSIQWMLTCFIPNVNLMVT